MVEARLVAIDKIKNDIFIEFIIQTRLSCSGRWFPMSSIIFLYGFLRIYSTAWKLLSLFLLEIAKGDLLRINWLYFSASV